MISAFDKVLTEVKEEETGEILADRFTVADKIEEITGAEGKDKKVFPTVTKRTMKNVKTGHRTEVTYKSVSYNLGLKDKDFSERQMRRPPRSWIR